MGFYLIITYVGAFVALLPLYYALKSSIRNSIIKRTTALQDLPNLASPRIGKRIQGTAVVCGGSIAGLWTARVCADHFEDVLIVEPEEWLGTNEGSTSIYNAKGEKVLDTVHDRTRVVQYNVLHVFWPLACRALKRFCPDVEKKLINDGFRIKKPYYNTHINGIFTDYLPYHDYPQGGMPTTYFVTRETFERTLRNILYKSSSRIRWYTGTVTGLQLSTENNMQVEAVSVRSPGSTLETAIPSSLVVDCSGGAHAGLKWLKRLSPSVSVDDFKVTYDAKIRYKDFRFPVPPAMRDGLPIPGGYNDATFIYAYAPLPPHENRLFVAQRIEGHRIEICCGAMGDCDFPEHPSELVPWARSLRGEVPVPEWVLNMVENLRENEDKVAIKDTGRIQPCTWIHFEQMSKIAPSNFIAVGDSVMRVNPIYGQGCTKACVGAMTLDGLLREVASGGCIPGNFSREFFKLHASRMKPLWDGTKSLDYGWDTTIPMKGETLAEGSFARFFLKYFNKLLTKADKDATSALFHYRMFLAPATDMFQPIIVAKVLLLALQEYFSSSLLGTTAS